MKNAPVANPWLILPKLPPFVLPQDEPVVDVYSAARNPSLTAYRLHLPPLPFQGNSEAPIVLLGLNPGYKKADEDNHSTSEFRETNFRNYRHDPTLEYPLFFLDPKLDGDAGQKWWHKRLKPLRQFYNDDKLLARAILSVQYVPYRSTAYKHSRRLLESQKYGFELVRQAVERGALIIALRSVKLWQDAVSELKDYPRFYQLSSPLNPVLSEQQLGEEGYQELITELEKVRQQKP
ncbi:MAG: hypothetical protein ACRYFZ_18820 [Janthinobacterium lividum]